MPECLDIEEQLLWRMIKRSMQVPAPSPLFTPEGLTNSDSGKSEILTSSLQVKWQAVSTVWSGSDWDGQRSDANLTICYREVPQLTNSIEVSSLARSQTQTV